MEIGAVHRHPAHRNILPAMLAALGQHDAERAARHLGIVEEQLVEIAHPVEQQAIRIGRLDLDVLLHEGRNALVVAGLRGGGSPWERETEWHPWRDARACRVPLESEHALFL